MRRYSVSRSNRCTSSSSAIGAPWRSNHRAVGMATLPCELQTLALQERAIRGELRIDLDEVRHVVAVHHVVGAMTRDELDLLERQACLEQIGCTRAPEVVEVWVER